MSQMLTYPLEHSGFNPLKRRRDAIGLISFPPFFLQPIDLSKLNQ